MPMALVFLNKIILQQEIRSESYFWRFGFVFITKIIETFKEFSDNLNNLFLYTLLLFGSNECIFLVLSSKFKRSNEFEAKKQVPFAVVNSILQQHTKFISA